MPEYRIEYFKHDEARWLSHLELIRTFIRALRRSGLPLVFSQGFNPHPRLSYGPSLGVGVAGLREYLDVELATSTPLDEGMSALGQQFPSGLGIRCLMELAPSGPGLGKSINCAWYRVALSPEQTAVAWQQAIERLIGGSSPIYYKRPKDGRLFDVRSALLASRLVSEDDGLALDLLVELGDGSIPLRGLVETLLSLAEVAGGYEPGRVTRMALLRHNGGLVSPLGEQKLLWEM
jgi:radical SAM-linked protein